MASSPLLFFITVLVAFFNIMGEGEAATISSHTAPPGYLNYTTVTGFFLQDDPSTDASTFNYNETNLGLINRSYDTDKKFDPKHKRTQWERFEYYVRHLNRNAPRNVQYKLLIMGRHGEGYHNVAESFYGTDAWDCYWSELDGNGTITWSDAHLTGNGIAQAEVAHSFWADALKTKGIPPPESYYTSPLARCLETARVTFSGLKLPNHSPFKPVVKELLREAIGIHTCDRRSTRTWILQNYPSYVIEGGFAENDPLWTADLRESSDQRAVRLRKLLDDVFTNDDGVFISFTSHSGSIGSILSVVGHRTFSLKTGAVIPVLVKAEKLQGSRTSSSIAPSETAPTCSANPSSAILTGTAATTTASIPTTTTSTASTTAV